MHEWTKGGGAVGREERKRRDNNREKSAFN